MNRLLRGSVGVVIIVGGSMLAQANEVTDWNEMLFRASAVASGNASPLNITRNSALVEAAVFDAVNGIEKQSASGRSPCAARLERATDVLKCPYVVPITEPIERD
jgi:hypothetical protein